MTGILSPFVNILVSMGASVFSAYIVIICGFGFAGVIIGSMLDQQSSRGAIFLGGLGLFFGIALVISEVFPGFI